MVMDEEENQTIDPAADSGQDENTFTDPAATEILVTSPVDNRAKTTIETEKGTIQVIHEITFGEVILSTLIFATLIFMILDRVIRR
jgi:hypothetical protein